jgi:glutamine synthetase
MLYKLEYVWLDGYQPEPNLRSKIKIIDLPMVRHYSVLTEKVQEWGFDGSSTKQAQGSSSDCILKPVQFYFDNYSTDRIPTIYVMCEVLNADRTPHVTNHRDLLSDNPNLWLGFEQEYFLKHVYDKTIIGHNDKVEPQGKYYCGVGGHVYGRSISEQHLEMCLSYGINVEGTNAEVALGQWEFQTFTMGSKKACDDLWMARYFLNKIAESYGLEVELHPKPLGKDADWNGSGLHTNFSNKRMREVGGKEYFEKIFYTFESRTKEHIAVYGSDNDMRLTGKHETQSIDKFSWGISDRGASIRVSPKVASNWKGYLEDRRPASNANPYEITKVIQDSLEIAGK